MIVGCYYTTLYCDGVDNEGTDENIGKFSQDYLRHQFPDQYGPVSDGGRRQAYDASASGPNKTETYKELRLQGWLITKDDRAFCPGCVELGRHKS